MVIVAAMVSVDARVLTAAMVVGTSFVTSKLFVEVTVTVLDGITRVLRLEAEQ